MYSPQLGGRENSRIVQVVITLKNKTAVNSNKIGNFQDVVNNPKMSSNGTLTAINNQMRDLGYNIRKLTTAYAYDPNAIMTPINPTYNQMMDISNPKASVAAYKRFKSRFV